MSKREIAASLGVSADGRPGLHRAQAVRGPQLAAAGGLTDEALEVRLYRHLPGRGLSAAAELGGGAPRAAARDNAAAVLVGASRRLSERLWLQPFELYRAWSCRRAHVR